MADTFWQDRLTATETLIASYEDAVSTLVAGQIQSYELDTGQGKQRVTKVDVPKMQEQLDSLYNRRATLYARVNGGGSVMGRPGW